MREREPEAPFYTNAGEKNTKDGDARSVQPLKIRHNLLWSHRCLLGYSRSCSQNSTSTTGWGPAEHTFALGRATGWCCLFLS